ncbi:MAG: SigE family RNA polymerase sigma factor [Jatrophihabitans sp.]
MEFSDYVRTQRPALMRFATVLTGHAWLADELVSDVLGKAFERWDRITAMERPHAYVRRMIVNEHLSWHRRMARRRSTVDLAEMSIPIPDGTASHAERDAMIGRLSQLPPRQRAAVVLRYYLGLTDGEIAAQLGCRQSTVRSQIARALNSLRIDITETAGRQAVDTLESR